MKIAILLSTYNGEKFLKTQLESLIEQTNKDWHLYIRDDGSTDTTIQIINDYIKQYPTLISLISDDFNNLRSANSFMTLLGGISSDYYMFCDQDDFWKPEKIDLSIRKIKELESINLNKPVMIFTDLEVVDSNLKTINNSMWEYSNIDPNNAKIFYKNAINSTATGCTIIINDLLKQRVLPYPKDALMHDWWISLNAAHFGVVDYIAHSTILYRQHSNNVIGAEKTNKNQYFKKLYFIKNTIKENIKWLKMLYSLPFKVNYFYFFWMKLKKVLLKK